MADTFENEINSFMLEHGWGLAEFLEQMGNYASSCMQMSDENHRLYCEVYDELFSPSITTKNKWNKLEDLAEVLFVKSFPNIFEVIRNCRTSTNEIDLLINWTQKANSIGLTNEFGGLGNTFLCECKNYEGKVDVTYIGKFYSLLSCSNTYLGIMIAWNDVTGTGWSAGRGLIKKIALAEKRYIIVITQKDLYDIYLKKTNLFELIKTKYRALKLDISYEKYITKHKLSDEWSLSK